MVRLRMLRGARSVRAGGRREAGRAEAAARGVALNNLLKNIGIWLVIGLVVLTVVKQFDSRQATQRLGLLFRVHGQGQGGRGRERERRRPQDQLDVGTDKKRNS